MTEHARHAPLARSTGSRANAIAKYEESPVDDDDALSGDLNASDIEPMTDAEWELMNLEAACEAGNEMWSAVLRAMYRDTRQVPAQYHMTTASVRRALDDVRAMANERRGDR